MGRAFLSWLSAAAIATASCSSFCSAQVPLSSAEISLDGRSANTYCCSLLEKAGLSRGLLYPRNKQYTAREDSYWSKTAQLKPWCIYQPRTAHDVSKAVVALAATQDEYTQCHFAIRSGGHTTWAGSNDIKNGVTIDLGLMNSTTYHENNKTASVLPGSRWGAVYEALDPLHRGVAGGRAATVGVGGFLLGGGNNFYAPLKGLATDNVAQFEVVLTNGSIIYANSKANTDLFRALKGGTANFGIVTRYDLITWDAPGLWGGVVTYPNSTKDQQLKAFKNFADNIEKDPYATAITIFQFSSKTNQTIVINAYDYAKPVANAPAFKEYTSIPGNTSDSMRITNMTDLVTELDQAGGFRDVFVSNTWVNDIRVLEKALDIHNELSGKIWADKPIGPWVLQDMVQPIPPLYAKKGDERGGNVMGLDRFETDTLVLFQTYLAWTDASQDAMFEGYGQSYIKELDAYAKSIGKDNPWVYLNYAYKTQDPLKGYGKANLEKIRKAAKKYDPKCILQELAPGGFKVSKA